MTLLIERQDWVYNIRCPKCKTVGLCKVSTGKTEKDYAYWCVMCEDQIAKEAVIYIERQK